MSETVVIAMSGGVDSSVAALLLKEQGYKVVGVTLRLYDSCGRPAAKSCCAIEDAADARDVARALGIEHRLVEHQAAFDAEVIQPFVRSYLRGETPNPCIMCNERVKFGTLWEYAMSLGASKLATGHHARMVERGGRYEIHRGADRAKDQSYVLFPLTDEQRRRTLLPVGEWTKEELRAKAREAGLPTYDKAESQDICFVGRRSYTDFLASRGVTSQPGTVRHVDGEVLGRHDGIHHFTVGQRRGLGIPWSEPLYVTALNPSTGDVTVGPRSSLGRPRFRVSPWNWHAPPDERPPEADIQVRYHQVPKPARFREAKEGVVLEWCGDPRVVTPGQAAVAYSGDRVLGGGWIRRETWR
ncbi:MAG: tRNA 2-thiouridine(34) synthase MnmA [Acidobacteriota bacterium]|jgi:tRNA-uridine 2-sulfurtransferase